MTLLHWVSGLSKAINHSSNKGHLMGFIPTCTLLFASVPSLVALFANLKSGNVGVVLLMYEFKSFSFVGQALD
jgi:hypothetical protein